MIVNELTIQLATRQRLFEGVKSACPFVSFDFGPPGDSSAIKFVPDKTATPQQIVAAQSFINSFDWSDAAAIAIIEAQEPALKNAKDNSAQMVAEIDAFLAAASKAELAELRAEAIASALRQKTLIQAVERLAGKT